MNSQAGEYLADGLSACIWAIIGDQDYKRDCLLLPNVSSGTPCAHCPCNNHAVPWFDFRPQAAWVGLICTLMQWMNSQWNRSELFKIIGVTILTVYPDWMHDKNLGTDKVTSIIIIIMVMIILMTIIMMEGRALS